MSCVGARSTLLRSAREREHILLGFEKALLRIDEVIALISRVENPRKRAKVCRARSRSTTSASCAPTLKRAPAIRLHRAPGAGHHRAATPTPHRHGAAKDPRRIGGDPRKIAGYLEILNSEERLNEVLIGEFEEVKRKFGDDRRTEIGFAVGDISIEDLIADEDMVVTVTHTGYLKRTALDTYRKQGRGGRGRTGMGTRSDDFIEHLFVASTHSYILVFTNLGRLYWVKVYNIPDAGATGKGRHVANLINLMPDETVQAFLPVKEFPEDQFIVMATKQGTIKKCSLDVFSRPMSRGIIAIGLKDDDELVSARLLEDSTDILIATHEGQAIRFNHEDVRPMGRPAAGVRGIRLGKHDWVIALLCVKPEHLVLSMAENGIGKRTQLDEYRLTNRGGKGVINMKTSKRTGDVITVMKVSEDDDVIIITRQGKIIRIESSTIRKTGRSASGVKLVNPEEGDVVAAASVAPKEELDELEGEGGENGQGTLIQ
ncbi:MAG: DNA gyrase C-terminal beta-propeller domain-containing protein [Bryobacterales bacterium]